MYLRIMGADIILKIVFMYESYVFFKDREKWILQLIRILNHINQTGFK